MWRQHQWLEFWLGLHPAHRAHRTRSRFRPRGACIILLTLLSPLALWGLIYPTGGFWSHSVPIDLNKDGFLDFGLRTDQKLEDGYAYIATFTSYLDPLGHSSCLGTNDPSTGTFVPVALEKGTLVSTNVVPKAEWGGSIWLRTEGYFSYGTNYSHGSRGLLSTNCEQAYLGVRFQAADGLHLGWVLLKAGTNEALLLDFGFHPKPNAAIAVGDKPSWTNDAPQTLAAIDLDGDNGIDFTVARRSWTNQVTSERFTESSLWGAGTNEVLCAPAEPGWPNGWYPVVLSNQTTVPRIPTSPASWFSLHESAVCLVSKSETPDSLPATYGPLQGLTNAFVGVRFDGRYGWLRLADDGKVLGSGYLPSGLISVGEPSPPADRRKRARAIERIDFNQDGLVDAVFRFEAGESIQAWTLYTLGNNALFCQRQYPLYRPEAQAGEIHG
jgi:hypothetical protein